MISKTKIKIKREVKIKVPTSKFFFIKTFNGKG